MFVAFAASSFEMTWRLRPSDDARYANLEMFRSNSSIDVYLLSYSKPIVLFRHNQLRQTDLHEGLVSACSSQL